MFFYGGHIYCNIMYVSKISKYVWNNKYINLIINSFILK